MEGDFALKYRANKKTWVVNNFIKRWKNNEINFNNPIQRGIVWNNKDRSLYIHSLLYDILIYQKPFLISKKENGYDVLDGKQRGMTLLKYTNNEFALTGLENEPLIMIKGEPYQINGKYFKQLPEKLQMDILDFEIEIAMLEDAPVEIEALFFERSNSGRAMTKIDMARSKNRDMTIIKKITEHEIFGVMFSQRMQERFSQDEIVVKTYQALYEDDPDYSAKKFAELMENLVISEDEETEIIEVYDKVLAAYKQVNAVSDKIARMMLKKTHFLSYVPFINKFKDIAAFAKWILEFYSNPTDEYTEASVRQTTSPKNTHKRREIIEKSVTLFCMNQTENNN